MESNLGSSILDLRLTKYVLPLVVMMPTTYWVSELRKFVIFQIQPQFVTLLTPISNLMFKFFFNLSVEQYSWDTWGVSYEVWKRWATKSRKCSQGGYLSFKIPNLWMNVTTDNLRISWWFTWNRIQFSNTKLCYCLSWVDNLQKMYFVVYYFWHTKRGLSEDARRKSLRWGNR